jgi:hypothetical protein
MQWDTILITKPTIKTYAMTHCSLLSVSAADHCLKGQNRYSKPDEI